MGRSPRAPGGCWPWRWRPRWTPMCRGWSMKSTSTASGWWSGTVTRRPRGRDRRRAGRGGGTAGERPPSRRGDGRAAPVPQLDHPAVGPQVTEGGRGAAVDVSAGMSSKDFALGAGGVQLRFRGGSVGVGRHPPHYAVAGARTVLSAVAGRGRLRVHVGGRDPLQRPLGREPPGAPWWSSVSAPMGPRNWCRSATGSGSRPRAGRTC